MNRFTLKATAAFISVLMLTGCTVGSSVDNLLSPPKLSEEQTEIYNALISAVGEDIQLQYPKSGSYRSAFVIEDIDDEQGDEAIVFYQNLSDKTNDGSIRVNILDIRDGKWQSVFDHAGIGTGIERVIFSELGSSGRKSIIIGYNMLSSDKNFKAYRYENGVLINTYIDNYSSIFVSDMDRNGQNELVVIHPNNEYTGKQAFFSLISDDGESLYESSSVLLNGKNSEFINIASGYVGTDTPAIFIDGLSSGQLSTEIIYCINGTLRNPLYLSNTDTIKDTVRPTGYLSTDIDLDGIIEIPTLSYFPGYSQDSREKYIMTNWNVLNNYAITKKYPSYYNVSEGYCFIIPSRWDGVVTIKNDTSTGDIVFYKYRADILNSTEELLRISVVSEEYRDEKLANGYTLIKKRDNINYLYKAPDNTTEPLILTSTEISNNFYLMA